MSGEATDRISLERVVGVAKRREGLKKQHGVLFFPERDRTAVRPSPPTELDCMISFAYSRIVTAIYEGISYRGSFRGGSSAVGGEGVPFERIKSLA